MVVEREGDTYTLHVHTAGADDGYTLHVYTAGYGKEYTLTSIVDCGQ
jgi:hypothetical protein